MDEGKEDEAMRKIHLLALALFAVFALSAAAASSAFAEGELLLNGGKLGAEQEIPIEVTGELLLEDSKATIKPDVLCSGIFMGHTLGPFLMYITELLMLNSEALNENGENVATGGVDIECEAHSTCENPTLVVALGFPWHVELELILVNSASVYLVHFLGLKEIEELGETALAGEPEYHVFCKTIFGTEEDLCHGLSWARVNNTSGGLLGYFNELALTEPWGAESPKTECKLGGAASGLLESVTATEEDTEASGGLITSSSGTLTVSE